MGEPISGAWARKYQRQVPYADARVWGTGINPVHAVRGDDGRPYTAKLDAGDMGLRTEAAKAVPEYITEEHGWGYQPEDIAGLDVYSYAAIGGISGVREGWPPWEGDSQSGQSTPVNRSYIAPYAQRPLGAGLPFRNFIRGIRAGSRDTDYRVSNEVPTETVSEGWVNKPASGMNEGIVPDDLVLTSSPDQYERNTSMQQRHKTLNNERAMLRGADDARTDIPSRIAPMKLKVYSGDQRHYDMFPYQGDVIPRPFTYRTFGQGPQSYLRPNDQHIRTPLQRTPPPDASMGVPDTELSSEVQYGYENEDIGYY